jgi:TPR repeat protein
VVGLILGSRRIELALSSRSFHKWHMDSRTLLRLTRFWLLLLAAPLWFGCSAEEKKAEAPTQARTNKTLSLQNQKRVLESRSMEAPAPAPAPTPTATADAFRARLQAITGKTYPSNDEIKAKAEKGDVAAQLQLAGNLRQQGEWEEGTKWLRTAADNGSPDAQHLMGVSYVFGQGVEQDYAEAVKWFAKAAEQGDVGSQYSLGVRYLKGDHVEKNYAEAVKWFTMAAVQGSGEAQNSLGRRYAAGEGVAQDKPEAYKWYTLSSKHSGSSAGDLRDKLAESMTPEQIADGEKRAENFVPPPKAKP